MHVHPRCNFKEICSLHTLHNLCFPKHNLNNFQSYNLWFLSNHRITGQFRLGGIFTHHSANAELAVAAQAFVQTSFNTSVDRCSTHPLDPFLQCFIILQVKNKPKPEIPSLQLNQLESIASHLSVMLLQEEPRSIPFYPQQ